ncbi:hypothetical protein Aduo_016639 [Ancylostoma duodenale]
MHAPAWCLLWREAYCNSRNDIVTWARVMSIDGDLEEPETPWKYTIWHFATWKGYDKVKDNATIILTTPNSDSQCGARGLWEEGDYILAGKLKENGEIYITTCDLILPYEQHTSEDIDLLRDLRYGTKKCESS